MLLLTSPATHRLTGNAPVPMGEPAAFDQAMDITQDGAEEQQEVFEADFEFDFAVADVDEIEAVFGPTPAKTTSEAAPKTGAREKDVPVSPLPSESIETVPRVIPQTDASASAAKPSTAGGEIPSAVAEPSSVPIQAVPSKDRPSVAAALAPAEEDASASTSVPAGKPLRQVGAAEVAPAPVSAVAASSNAAPVEKQPQRPLPSEPLPKPGPARGPVGAPFDDSGVHFVANETDVTRSLKKGGMAAGKPPISEPSGVMPRLIVTRPQIRAVRPPTRWISTRTNTTTQKPAPKSTRLLRRHPP
jgi:hypothetical protein